VKKAGACQGFDLTTAPFAKVSNTINANKIVATTDIREPKLDTMFHPE
jgi:hypothetical protein